MMFLDSRTSIAFLVILQAAAVAKANDEEADDGGETYTFQVRSSTSSMSSLDKALITVAVVAFLVAVCGTLTYAHSWLKLQDSMKAKTTKRDLIPASHSQPSYPTKNKTDPSSFSNQDDDTINQSYNYDVYEACFSDVNSVATAVSIGTEDYDLSSNSIVRHAARPVAAKIADDEESDHLML